MALDDRMYTFYTQRELNSVYFSNAIKYDPFNYSFKKTIKLSKDANKGFMSKRSMIDEFTIAQKIHENWGVTFNPNDHIVLSPFLDKVTALSLNFDDYNNKAIQSPSRLGTPTQNVFLDLKICNSLNGVQLDHYKLLTNAFPNKAHRWTDALFTTFKKSNLFNAFTRLTIALDSKNSISKYLLYTFTQYKDTDLEDLINTKHLRDALNIKDTNISLIFDNVFNQCNILCNLKSKESQISVGERMNEIFFWANDVPSSITLNNEEHRERLSILGAFQYIMFGIEVLYHIYNMTDITLQETLLDQLRINYDANPINNYLYFITTDERIEFPAEILDIFSCKDNTERYNKIKHYMYNVISINEIVATVQTMNTLLDSKKFTKINFNDFLGTMVNYAHDLSLHYIRIEYLNILREYCKLNKIDISKPSLKCDSSSDEDEDDDDWESDDDYNEEYDSDSEGLLNEEFVDYSSDTSSKHSKKTKKTIKDEMYDELDKSNTTFKYNDYHYEVRDVFDSYTTHKDTYEKVAATTYLLNRNLIKQIKDIKVYNTGGKNPGETKGKLDVKNLHKYKTTNKIFCKNTYKIKESDLAFGIVLDVSGSMCGNGIKNGKATMIVLHETLKALSINHSIVTHTSHGHHHCIINRYQSFKEDKTFKINKNYALAKITEHSGNCDSAALCYMEKALLRAKNKDKICLIFSDGQPTECSEKELKLQVKHMESNGIKVIGIGVDFPEIKRYYTDYANGKNLKEMLDIVSKILKEYVLTKDD